MTASGCALTGAQRADLLHHPRPTTVKDMLSFLRLTDFSRHYIPMYVDLTAPMRELVKKGNEKPQGTIGMDP